MSRSKFENGLSYYEITRKIEEFADYHAELTEKQEKEDNLRAMLLFTIEYPEYMNYYEELRETIMENVKTNYELIGEDPEFLTVCSDWLEMFECS